MGAKITSTDEIVLRRSLDELESCLEEMNEAYAEAQWRTHFGRVNGDELGRLEKARSALLLDDQVRDALRQWDGQSRDLLLDRRVALLLRHFRWAEVESQTQVYRLRNRIDQDIIDFRPQVAGVPTSRVGRSEILRRDPNRDRRREAWLAMAPLAAKIQTDVRRLMRQRQDLVRTQGYDDYVTWALDIAGLSRPWVEAFFDELIRLTDGPYRAWLAEVTQHLALTDGLRPWDLAFAAEQAASLPNTAFPRDGLLPAVRAVAKGLGLTEAAVGVRVDMADIPYAALCYAVCPPNDVRILLSPRDGLAHYDVLFHEFGHALHWRCLRPTSPVFSWESPPFNEAMACLWGRLVSESDWLMERDGVLADQVAEYRRRWARRMIFRLRAFIAQARFEYLAYQAANDDLLTLHKDVFEEHLQVPYDLVPGWADSPYWTSHPIYLQNYVIGEVAASQTLAALRQRFTRLIGDPQVGRWLTECYYAPGASLPWTEKIERATGARLSSADLIADLGCGGGVGA